jgi:hypothetical protein
MRKNDTHMTLSSRAINNIVIFAMLAMIMLFNIDAWLPKPSSQQQTQLIGEHDMLLRIDMHAARVERVGTDWRLVSDKSESEALSKDALLLVQRWQAVKLRAIDTIPAVIDSTEVNLWLATHDKPVNLILHRTQSGTYVLVAKQYYHITNTNYSALVF